jgi:quercetin dioxygenase-like cupin family protein
VSYQRQPLIGRADGEPIVGSPFITKIAGAMTEGRVVILQATMAPGELVDIHVHTREDEVTYVVAGHIGAMIGDDEVEAPTGAFLWKPRDVPHAMWNATPEPAVLLEIITPAGFETFFAEAGRIFIQRPPEPGEVERLAATYGETFFFERSRELADRLGLRQP